MSCRCDNCGCWKVVAPRRAPLHPDDRTGECRRHAPRPLSGSFEYEVLRHLTMLSWQVATEEQRKTDFSNWEEATDDGIISWPRTHAADWCCEYRDASEGFP